MRRLATMLALAAGFGAAANAQEPAATGQGNQVVIEDLRTPTSPAFVVLDVAPASVERPEKPKALIANLLSTAAQSEGFPKNYALEVAPYWLKSHPNLQFENYQRPSIPQSIIRTLTLSVATAPLVDPEAAEATTIGSRLGIGFRTTIVGGQPNPRMKAVLDDLHNTNVRLQNELDKTPPDEAIVKKLTGESEALGKIIQSLDQQRVGWFVTAAVGQAWNFPADSIEQQSRDRWGVWVTPAYRMLACVRKIRDAGDCKSVIDFIAVVRSTGDADDDERDWDIGGRLLWEPRPEFTISGEFLRRRSTEEDRSSTERTVAMLEYRISEGLHLFGSFGRTFEDDDTRRTLVSILGVSLGFGANPTARR
jgi:hypothetical protein